VSRDKRLSEGDEGAEDREDSPQVHAERRDGRRCYLHATPRVFAWEVASERDWDQGHVLGILGPESDEEWVADDLHAQCLHVCRWELFLCSVRGGDQVKAVASHALFHLKGFALMRVVGMEGLVRFAG